MPAVPILYSFRRCPYAIRARMALAYAGTVVELREVVLADKPAAMLEASAKGTVPVLVLPEGEVIDESEDVMQWALAQSDPAAWNSPALRAEAASWREMTDGPFKRWLDKYKYADRHPEHGAEWYRDQAAPFLERLNSALGETTWLAGAEMGLADVTVFPFVRQFAMVDRPWFDQTPYRALIAWLEKLLEHPLFTSVMQKYARWEPGSEPVFFQPRP